MDGQIPFGSKVEIYGKAAFFSQLVFVFRLLIVLHHLGSFFFFRRLFELAPGSANQ